MLEQFELLTTRSVGKAVKQIQDAFNKKKVLASTIAKLIKDYEDETGLVIDMIKYQRDITIPIKSKHRYTDLTIIISSEEQKGK